MSPHSRWSASVARIVQHFSDGVTVQIINPGSGTFNNDLSVDVSAAHFTVACTDPVPFPAGDVDGDRILRGDLKVLIWEQDSLITFDPQPGHIAVLKGEQYRIHRAEYLSGGIQLHLRGGAAEGTAGA